MQALTSKRNRLQHFNEVKLLTLGEFLRARREANGLSTRKVEEMCGVSDTFISLLENEKRAASPDTLQKLSRPYGVSYYELLQHGGFLPEHAWLALTLGLLRRQQGQTPEAFADQLGLTIEEWQTVEAGGSIPPKALQLLQDQFGTTTIVDLLKQDRS
ncbi:helix-turn-helix domain-containing protein [Tumebacillus amylolyticus]|uniref:helix-turn-helix domain-containing protein n=1 Tax=Tumebacillus amylolyticus TaxID=2801339 RepID=UPI0024BFD38E|nr:helix-turn-helix transcriptional regulator [Tumebacillus amylolyticus]